jgi:hypothetical protein
MRKKLLNLEHAGGKVVGCDIIVGGLVLAVMGLQGRPPMPTSRGIHIQVDAMPSDTAASNGCTCLSTIITSPLKSTPSLPGYVGTSHHGIISGLCYEVSTIAATAGTPTIKIFFVTFASTEIPIATDQELLIDHTVPALMY